MFKAELRSCCMVRKGASVRGSYGRPRGLRQLGASAPRALYTGASIQPLEHRLPKQKKVPLVESSDLGKSTTVTSGLKSEFNARTLLLELSSHGVEGT